MISLTGVKMGYPVHCGRLKTTGVPILSSFSWRSRRAFWQWKLSLWWVDIVGCLLGRWDLLPICNLPKQGDADVPATARACSVCRGFAEQWIYWICSSVAQGKCQSCAFCHCCGTPFSCVILWPLAHEPHVTALILLDGGAREAP